MGYGRSNYFPQSSELRHQITWFTSVFPCVCICVVRVNRALMTLVDPWKIQVAPTVFEPTTSAMPVQSSQRLRYEATIGVKIVETLLSFRVDFKLGAKMAPSPAPPGQCCVFLFSTSLVDSATTLIKVGEGGVSRKRTFWTSFLCKQ